MKGVSRIYGFPFRIYNESSLPEITGRSHSGAYRIHLYPLFSVQKQGMPLSPDIPFPKWPKFEWSPRISSDQRLLPPSGFGAHLGKESFDALRVNVWGANPQTYAEKFVSLLLAWIRHLTSQEWIGAYEAHTDSSLKYQFEIDDDGKAVASPEAFLKAMSPSSFMRLLDASLLQDAFRRAMKGESPPLYWGLWQDALLYRAMQRTGEAALSLTLSLEVARDVIFPRFARTKAKPELGAALLAPFNGTDLLFHLSSALEQVRCRNLQKEKAKVWQSIKELYIARNHVAHGRPPVFKSTSGMKRVEDQHLRQWSTDTRTALLWIEGLREVRTPRRAP